MAISSPFSDQKARLSLTKSAEEPVLGDRWGTFRFIRSSEARGSLCERFHIAGYRCSDRVEFSSRPTSTEFVQPGGPSGLAAARPPGACAWPPSSGLGSFDGSDLLGDHIRRRCRGWASQKRVELPALGFTFDGFRASSR